MLRLDKAEMELLASYENDEWVASKEQQATLAKYGEYARHTFKKDKRLNIRLSTKDLEGLQKKALAEGLPYQTLIASILHKYVAGRLMEKS